MGKVTADISNFSSQYSNLNGLGQKFDISIYKLAHSAMTVGQGGYRSVFRLGFFRLAQLLCTILANVNDTNDNLRINRRYYDLEKSEKDSVSYLLGMAFTKVFAEKLLKIKWLRHLKNVPNVSIQRGLNPNPPKITLYNNTKRARTPDLVGFDDIQGVHIFESKGSCSGFNTTFLQHAIDQVSQVSEINSIAPKTRVAFFSNCNTSGINVHIVDPTRLENGYNIEFDKSNPIRGYYDLFLNDFWRNAPTRKILGQLYRVRQIGVPDLFFGINEKILEYLKTDIDYNTIVEWSLEMEDYDGMIDDNSIYASISNDGTALFGSLDNYST